MSTSSISSGRLRSDSSSGAEASGSQKNKMTTRKGMWGNQPRLIRITPIALQLGITADQSMTFLGTDFEKHAIWQGSLEKPAAKDFVARKVRTIEWSKV
jgi:hypothetical protein